MFRGTRVPVHVVAAMLEQGSTEADILKAYPRITAEMVRLAPAYAQAYPIRRARSPGVIVRRYSVLVNGFLRPLSA